MIGPVVVGGGVGQGVEVVLVAVLATVVVTVVGTTLVVVEVVVTVVAETLVTVVVEVTAGRVTTTVVVGTGTVGHSVEDGVGQSSQSQGGPAFVKHTIIAARGLLSACISDNLGLMLCNNMTNGMLELTVS